MSDEEEEGARLRIYGPELDLDNTSERIMLSSLLILYRILTLVGPS
jgi:hypothetical protein